MEQATFAGGCFWCTEAIFLRLKGVKSAIPGFTGGTTKNPTYKAVSSGTTGHAEAVQVTFDPAAISYRTLVGIFFHFHDPTTRDKQGNDVGTQYRSAIFTHSDTQRKTVKKIIAELTAARAFSRLIVTEVVPYVEFVPAEEKHKNYYEKNSYLPYCKYVIDPKIAKLLKEYSKNVKEEYRKEK